MKDNHKDVKYTFDSVIELFRHMEVKGNMRYCTYLHNTFVSSAKKAIISTTNSLNTGGTIPRKT